MSLKIHPYSLILTAVLLLAGCATLPPPQPPRPALDLTPYLTKINGLDYLPLNTLCQQWHFSWNWDPSAQVAQVMTGAATVRVAPGLAVALVNGTPESLGAPVVVQGGLVWIPAKAATPWFVPLPAPAPPVAPGAHAIRTIVLDPGHGGHDIGALGPGGIREKDVVLDVARRLQRRLESAGIRVLMTRAEDRFISLDGRAAFANRQNADLFLSIHANSSRTRGASGYEIYYLSEATDDAARALAAAENASPESDAGSPDMTKRTEAIVWDLVNTENRTESRELASVVGRGLRRALPTPNRGVKSARFYVLKWAQMPAVLVEVGFVTNRVEGRRLRLADYRQRVAEGIAQGLLAYKHLYEKTNGFSN